MQPHPSTDIWIAVLLSKALPTRARLSFSHCQALLQEAYTSLLASSIGEQTEEARRSTVPQRLEQKPNHRKLIWMKKQKAISQMKGQGKIQEK